VTRPPHGTGAQVLRSAALDVAKERGIGGLSLREVAERGGVTHGLVRHHFGSRRRLINAALEEAATRTHFLSDDSGSLTEHIDARRGELRLQYEAIVSGEYSETIAKIYDGYRTENLTWAEGRSLPADEVTISLIGAVIDGLSIGHLAAPHAVDADAVLARLVDILSSRHN
jgi:AcrR family transcriptional regulator